MARPGVEAIARCACRRRGGWYRHGAHTIAPCDIDGGLDRVWLMTASPPDARPAWLCGDLVWFGASTKKGGAMTWIILDHLG